MKVNFLGDLRKVMTAVPDHQHQRSWKKCESTFFSKPLEGEAEDLYDKLMAMVGWTPTVPKT
jgi:hypothetical protein